MKLLFSIFVLAASLSIMPISIAQASPTSAGKHIVVRFTAMQSSAHLGDSNQVVPFDSQLLIINNEDSFINSITEKTPFELNLNASFIGLMLNTDKKNPAISVTFYEKNDASGETSFLFSGSGHNIMASYDPHLGNELRAY